MKYHTRTKWNDGDMTVSELPYDSIEAAAKAIVGDGDLYGGEGCVTQLFGLREGENGRVIGTQDFTEELIEACYEVWCEVYDANYCLSVPKLIEDKVDERFMFDGEVYVIRKGME